MNRLLLSLTLATILLLPGCVPRGKKKAPVVREATIEQVAYEACQNRDRIAADMMEQIADKIKAGELKYDQQVMDAVVQASDMAALAAAAPLTEAFAKTLNPGQSLDLAKAEKAVRELAAGRRRASK